ncbi:Protein of unknown function [Pyronema omphalodes CBS 100304]|uniref:Uncharacterized protein n=1 Tax=Pyronema omphalodes (strain CBS 100304) TaxID=1076935 RepID=U4LNA7_PYROM|nr:Protein of unknown function [Pyronema omphalodes CBS 100304]
MLHTESSFLTFSHANTLGVTPETIVVPLRLLLGVWLVQRFP